MKTKDICTRTLVPVVICAMSTLAAASSGTRPVDELAAPGRPAAMTVAEAPLVLSDFDRSALAAASLDGSAIIASLVGPERISLPRAGGTTTLSLQVQGLALSVRPVSLPPGITVSLSGSDLTLVSTANRTGLERVGSIAIMAQSPANARGGRARGILISGISQLPCTSATCPAVTPSAPTSITLAPLARTAGMDWSAVASGLRNRAGADAVLVAVEGNDSPNRTSGPALERLAQSCAANGVKCILELSARSAAAGSDAAPSAYFLSPDVLSGLYGTEAHLILSMRGEAQIEGKLGAISQLRAAGLTHTLLAPASAAAGRVLASDAQSNTLLAVERNSAPVSVSASSGVATIVVPQAVISTAPLAPVDLEINGQAFVVDRSLAAFDAAGGSVGLRFLQTGGLRWTIRKVPGSFVAGGSNFPQGGNVTLTVGPSAVNRSEHIEFSARSANGVVSMFIDVAVIQDATGTIF